MAATTDFVHDEDVVQAVITELERNLPAAWLDRENPLWGCKRIEFGDLSHWKRPAGVEPEDLCPYLLVYAHRTDDATAVYGGLGGKEGWSVPVRVVHLFRVEDQCYDETDLDMEIQPARAQCQRAKVLMKALFGAPSGSNSYRTLNNPTLTTADTSARVIECKPVNVIYELPELANSPLAGIAIDLLVETRTQ